MNKKEVIILIVGIIFLISVLCYGIYNKEIRYSPLPDNMIVYSYGANGLVAKVQGEEISYYHKDHLGSTGLVTDSSGKVISKVEYEPFGESFREEGKERYKYTGKEEDASGLYYYGARYYDASLGRFISVDPIKSYDSPYVYVKNNPMKYVDPSGEDLATAMPFFVGAGEAALAGNLGPQVLIPDPADAVALGGLCVGLYCLFFVDTRILDDINLPFFLDVNIKKEESTLPKGRVAGNVDVIPKVETKSKDEDSVRILYHIDVDDVEEYPNIYGPWVEDPIEAYGFYLEGLLGDKKYLYRYVITEPEFRTWQPSGYGHIPGLIEEERVEKLGLVEERMEEFMD